MKVKVKILQGAECNVDITHGDSVETLKELVKAQLNISPCDQRLLHKGKPLQEGTLLGDYNLKDGDRLHLVVKKDASPVAAPPVVAPPVVTSPVVLPSTGCIETQTEPGSRDILEKEMFRLMRPQYANDADTRKVISAFVKNLDKKLNSLSLEDIDRICEAWGRENQLVF